MATSTWNVSRVAIIGSFRQQYEQVLRVCRVFIEAGLEITSPKGTEILKPGIPFVRFETDNASWSDVKVQTVALHRILSADFVYVVAPCGYVGRTTCYEIGRVIQASRPIYFETTPADLPIAIPETHVQDASEIASKITCRLFEPVPLYQSGSEELTILEKDLLDGRLRNI